MFEYLKEFVVAAPPAGARYDYFVPVPVKQIEEAERRLGFKFPPLLRHFYEFIGHGNYVGKLAKEKYGALVSNEILHPRDVVEIYEGGGVYPSPFKFRRGQLPFFQMMEDKYLTVKPKSAKPEAVYFRFGDILIEANLDSFMRRLLDDPEFVDSVITAEWVRRDRVAAKAKKKTKRKTKEKARKKLKSRVTKAK